MSAQAQRQTSRQEAAAAVEDEESFGPQPLGRLEVSACMNWKIAVFGLTYS